MPLGLSPEERDLQRRAREPARSAVAPRAAATDRAEEYPWDVVRALADAGFLGMTIPRRPGGQGRSFLDAVLVAEEVSKACAVSARIVVEPDMGSVSAVMAYRTEAQRHLGAGLVLHGARRYSRDNPIGRMARGVRMFTVSGGTARMPRTFVASKVLGGELPQGRGDRAAARPEAAE